MLITHTHPIFAISLANIWKDLYSFWSDVDISIPHFLPSWVDRWVDRNKPDHLTREKMASKERIKTNYPGVWYADRNGVRTFYINYRKPGDRKKIEEKLRTCAQNWSAAKANVERTNRINGQAMTNAER